MDELYTDYADDNLRVSSHIHSEYVTFTIDDEQVDLNKVQISSLVVQLQNWLGAQK